MISKLTVFHRGGAVLWTSDDEENNQTKNQDDVSLNPDNTSSSAVVDPSTSVTSGGSNNLSFPSYLAINKLIQSVLLSERSGQDSMIYDSFTLKWTFENNFDLVFVAIYFSFQKLLYVDKLLKMVKEQFINLFNNSLNNNIISNIISINYQPFNDKYKRIKHYFVNSYKNISNPKKFNQTKKGKDHQLFSMKHNNKKGSNKSDKNSTKDGPNADISAFSPKSRRTKSGGGPRGFVPKNKKNVKKNKNKNKNKNKKNKNGKKKGSWQDFNPSAIKNRKVSKKDIDEFNMCSSDDDIDDGNELWEPSGNANTISSSEEEYSSDDNDDYSDLINGSTRNSDGIWNKFSKLIGNKPLEENDILPVLKELENKLSTKNVANVIAVELCLSLKKELIGKQIGTFNSIKTVVRSAMTESLQRILTPSRPVNILHGIRSAQDASRPYSIVFIGVNGVGKSTSLSKLIYYLKTRNLRVSVAACDTFRSGAVEQLKTHCRALKVRLFSQGYARDASNVAYRAIQDATKQGDDVILIDTAGRMQNNQPLMRSLVSLIQKNQPDLILFVGEALVGNDGVDQLLEFNKALKMNGNKRLIDGIVLTKFDTVDDKVGAAISMTYKSRKPIVFVGTGQTYPDLKKMDVRTLISKLLK